MKERPMAADFQRWRTTPVIPSVASIATTMSAMPLMANCVVDDEVEPLRAVTRPSGASAPARRSR